MTETNAKRVENVYRDAWRLMWGEYWRSSLILTTVLIVLIPFAVPVSLLAFGFWWTYLYYKVEKIFMRQFAEAHGLRYEKEASLDSVSGRLFSYGLSREIHHVFCGELGGRPLRLFNYKYTVGGGKNSRTYSFTVCELAFKKTQFPHILLLAPTMPVRYGSVDWFGSDRDIQVPLEGDMKKNFTLYTNEGYQIEALQIFSPEVLTFLHEHAKRFSIEFAGNKIYLYDDEQILNRTKLDELYTVAQKIFNMLAPLLDRLHDDFAALHPYYKKEG